MTFHIIYTPNSVKYLIHFIYSLLDYSPYHFCLVSNGCSPLERAILKKTAADNQRLSYYCFPTNQMQIHGNVLMHLQARCDEEYFCFMDSDIFATAPISDLKKLMEVENLTGLFSAMPIWVKDSETIFKSSFKEMLGTFNQMTDGTCIGGTYFSIYKNEAIREITQYHSLCFDECKSLVLAIDIQDKIQRINYDQRFFDTAKVINLFLNKHSFQLKNITVSGLYHIGGTSYEIGYQNQALTRKERLRRWLSTRYLKYWLNKWMAYKAKKRLKTRYKDTPKEEYLINYNQRVLHRNSTRQHFLKLYLALRDNQQIPPPPIFEDSEITHKVANAHDSYIHTFNKYHHLTSLSQ